MGTTSEKKGVGVIGYGGFGEFLRRAWDQMEQVSVVAICDAVPSRDPGGVRFYTSVADLLADDEVDIVSIATPPSTHKDLAILAMQAEKHVLIEKPLALSEKDALLVKRVAESAGRCATVNFVLRFNPIVEALQEITGSEVLGKLRRVDLRNYAMQSGVPEGHWFWDPEISGRILLEHGVHFFDLAAAIIGSKAQEVFSLGVDRKPGMEDRVFAAVKYESGVVGTYWHSFSRPDELETTTFHFAFDLGEIEMIGWIPLELRVWGWTGEQGLACLDRLGARTEDKDIEVRTARSSEWDYQVSHEVNSVIKLDQPKSDVYADHVRSMMADLVRAIDEPGHVTRVTLDDAIEAVRVAQLATDFAHPC